MCSEVKMQGSIRNPKLMPLWIAVLIDILGFYIIIPFLPSFIEIYQTTPLMIGLLLATNAIFTLFFAPILGKLSDKYGRKPLLLISQAGTMTAFLILAFSNSLWMLFLARIVDGIFGGNFPIAKAIISDQTSPKDRGIQMTNFGVIHTIAGLVGPGLGGILSIVKPLGDNYPVFAPGIGAAIMSFSTIVVTLFMLEESWSKERRLHAKKVIKVKIQLRKNKDALFLLTQFTISSISFIMFVSSMGVYMRVVMGLDPFAIGMFMTISGISRAIVRFTVFKPTLRKLGEKKMTRLGLIILVISFFLIGFAREPIFLIILLIFISYGVSCSRGLLISKTTQTVTPNHMGKINGYTTTLDSIAQIVGPIIGTFILTGFDPIFFGVVIGSVGLGAMLMDFNKIIPLMQRQKFDELKPELFGGSESQQQ
ncbi:MAG: MFS transporter [Promethearchaeota archaeon]